MIADCHVVNVNGKLRVQSEQEYSWSDHQHSSNISPHIQPENLHRRPHLESYHSASWEDICQVEAGVAWVGKNNGEVQDIQS